MTELAAVAVVLIAIVLLIPVLVWIVRSAKRNKSGFAVAWSLFFGWARGFGGAPDYVETVKDPERRRQTGASDGTPPVV